MPTTFRSVSAPFAGEITLLARQRSAPSCIFETRFLSTVVMFFFRYIIEFEVFVSRYRGLNVPWTKVLHVGSLEKPSPNCGPISHFKFNGTVVGRQIRFATLKTYGYGAAMSYFRVY